MRYLTVARDGHETVLWFGSDLEARRAAREADAELVRTEAGRVVYRRVPPLQRGSWVSKKEPGALSAR